MQSAYKVEQHLLFLGLGKLFNDARSPGAEKQQMTPTLSEKYFVSESKNYMDVFRTDGLYSVQILL